MNARMWAGAAALLFSVSLAADVKETEEMSFPVNPGARISLENINGEIFITAGSGDQVDLIARKKAGSQEYMDDLKIVVDADEDYIRIETRHPKSEGSWFKWGSNSSGSVSYELTVPGDVELDTIETVNGDVEISGVSGKVKASTVNGSLQVSELVSDVSLETVNGSVKAEFDTVGEGQRINAEAVNGKITLMLPADASARVNAETVNGSIDADDFGLEPEKGFVGRDLSGEIGGGAGRITLDTVNGSIKIRMK
ncbi:MAG: DUF4097 family beta strand repeat protein [Xanthomonadales bacterium]|nr:DUF4097 domain-containing protein [Gammaproteobacteria bacterium]MBT8064519.1 DUF4097 domain-containing protein [Gammaproteobacteria bacterium]NNJ65060.1 DUF4097 family beta strand repeat protein [Xanthomonadales bacterium]NNK32567.1 DUF4097 family beta strand repeat protein [Xanthomonadales bacterium]